MMTSDNFQRYKRVQTRFKLPHLHELKETFKFEIEDNDHLFDQIRMEMSDRIFVFTEKIIEPLIAEADSMASFLEQSMVTKQEREKLFYLYTKIQKLKWENNILSIDGTEEDMVKWIRKTWDLWNNEMKNELKIISKKMAESWEYVKPPRNETDYHQ